MEPEFEFEFFIFVLYRGSKCVIKNSLFLKSARNPSQARGSSWSRRSKRQRRGEPSENNAEREEKMKKKKERERESKQAREKWRALNEYESHGPLVHCFLLTQTGHKHCRVILTTCSQERLTIFMNESMLEKTETRSLSLQIYSHIEFCTPLYFVLHMLLISILPLTCSLPPPLFLTQRECFLFSLCFLTNLGEQNKKLSGHFVSYWVKGD